MKVLTILWYSLLAAGISGAATQVTRHAITWTFDQDYTTGTFVNGDPWVKEKTAGGGVRITNVNPKPGSGAGGDTNGSMVNPSANEYAQQGYDARGAGYSAAANVFRNGTSVAFPANTSLISSVSLNPANAAQERPVISDASVLTILPASANPAPGDFRPPYVGSDKSLKWNSADIIWPRLPALAPPPQIALVPTIASLVGSKLWLVNSCTSYGRDIHPSNNMPEYGRDLSNVLETKLLRSLLNDNQAAKEQLVIELIQIGLDIAGCVKMGMVYSGNGGQNQGYKMPMLYAGWLLDDAGIITMADRSKYFVFQEDHQTFYVAASDVADCPKYSGDGRQRDCYT